MLDFPKVEAALFRHRAIAPAAFLILVFLFLFGGYLTFVRPGRLVADARQSATQEIARAESGLSSATIKVKALGWFNESYLREPEQLLKQADQFLSSGSEGARARFAASEQGSWRAKVESFHAAEKAAKNSSDATARAEQLAVTAISLRADAVNQHQSLTASIAQAVKTSGPLTTRIDSETGRYPSSYGREVRGRSASIAERLKALAGTAASAAEFLPPDNELGKGDPKSALAQLTPGRNDCAKVIADIGAATEWLDLVNRQYTDADKKVAISEAAFGLAKAGLSERKHRTSYWLRSAEGLLASADTSTRAARQLLTSVSPGETVPDRPLAYRTAEEAATRTEKVLFDADREIALAASVEKDVSSCGAEIAAFSTLIGGYDVLFGVLQKNHDPSVWKEKEALRQQCGAPQLRSARADLKSARELAALDVQDFTEASRVVQRARANVTTWTASAQGLKAFVDELEGFRKGFPGERKRAQDVIEKERGDIKSYGSYDDAAQKSFTDSEKSVKRANEYARDRQYAQAMRYAKIAATQAKGTGARAKEAYDAHQRASSSSDSDSSWGSSSDSGWGGGSDSSWGGGSSSSGGSDSSWGGGSDSSWGGGSDSDW